MKYLSWYLYLLGLILTGLVTSALVTHEQIKTQGASIDSLWRNQDLHQEALEGFIRISRHQVTIDSLLYKHILERKNK